MSEQPNASRRHKPPPQKAACHAFTVGLAVALLAAGIVVLARNNLGYRDMWWDESAQFWVSQGVSGYAPPFTPRAGLYQVARMNVLENLDPGGFSVLLHLWTALATGFVHLRALSLAFFLLGMAAIGCIGWRLTRSPLFAVAAAAVPCLYPAGRYFGFEIRAYSMEMAGIAATALALLLVRERPSPGRAALLGLACAAFLTSRYSFVFAAVAVLGACWAWCLRPLPRRARRRLVAVLVAPVATVGVLVSWIVLRPQMRQDMKEGALGIASPQYTQHSVLGHRPTDLELWRRNLLSPSALPITACALAALLRRNGHRRVTGGAVNPDLERTRGTFSMLAAFLLGTQGLSLAASALGLYPWDLASRWSAYLLAVSALGAVALAAEAVALVNARLCVRPVAGDLARRVRPVAALAAVLVVAAGSLAASRHRQADVAIFRPNVARQIDLLPRQGLGAGSVFASAYEVPVLRYLYEHGPYMGRPEYPGAFRFETWTEWREKTPIAAGDRGIAYVITARPAVEMRARFPGAVVTPAAADSTRLLAVTPARVPVEPP